MSQQGYCSARLAHCKQQIKLKLTLRHTSLIINIIRLELCALSDNPTPIDEAINSEGFVNFELQISFILSSPKFARAQIICEILNMQLS
jgi:hypothetical protein